MDKEKMVFTFGYDPPSHSVPPSKANSNFLHVLGK